MILLGLAADPLLVSQLLPAKTWALNTLDKKTCLFVGVAAFVALRQPSTPRRVLVFDNREKAESLIGLTYIPDIDPQKAVQRVKDYTDTIKNTSIKKHPVRGNNIDPYILDMILKNKDKSFIHLYNTNIYGIKFAPTRTTIKNVYLGYLNGEMDRAMFDIQMRAIYPKRGETKEAVDRLMALTTTVSFLNLRDALQAVAKEGLDKIPEIAIRYKIEAFDINYMIANKTDADPVTELP